MNRALGQRGQWLPLDPPFADRATIGGLLASNDSGPLRHRFGTPRDLVIGIRLATTDGVLSKAGGQVVKNVAGYDLAKLVTGSFGSLAAIVSATFKLSPLPAASKTILVDAPDVLALASIVREMMGSQLEPIAFEVVADVGPPSRGATPFTLMLRFASLPIVVDQQIEHTLALPSIRSLLPASLKGRPITEVLHDGRRRRTRAVAGARHPYLERARCNPARMLAARGDRRGRRRARRRGGAGAVPATGDGGASGRRLRVVPYRWR